MKKFVKKLTAGLLAFAMTVSTYSAAFAAPENTGDTAANTDVITISEEAENTLEAAKALSSLNANYGSSESDQDSGAKAAIKDAIFNDYNSTTDLSRYGISAGEMDSLVAEILGEKNMTEAVDVTYDTDDEGNVTTTEVEMDPMVTLAAEELAENAQVYGLSEEQSQELLGMYAQYLQLFEENADIFGVQVPYNTTRDTNANPIGSLLDVAGVPADAAQAGYVGYDVLSGIIQLYYLGTQFAVQEYADDIRAARDEALDAIKGAKTDMQEYLLLNAWLADNCQFNMAYIMKEMVEPEPAENELYTYAYNCMYNMIKQQVYDGTYNALKDIYGEDQAKAIAEQQAAAYMVDVQENGGSGEQQAASTASAIVGMWGSNQVGVFVQKKAVCFGYATVYAYLLQCAHPEIYTKDGKDITTASNWKSYKELNYELDSNGDPVKGEDGNYKWSKDSAAIADYVKIIFDADTSMFGQEASFGEAHYWNAVKLDGKWYYVDPCYIDIYVECMNRDRVETDGNMNHLYFLFSDDSCREMYDGNIGELRTLYEGIATDQTYEDAWVAFIKSQPYKVDDRTYYFYDSTDLLDIMRQYGNGSSSNANSRASSDNSYEGLYNESEYKIVYHTDAQGDTSADFETLIDFNNGQVYNPSKKALEDNELIKELYAEHEEYVKEYPSIMISCAYYSNKIYFSLSNCVLSYDLKTGAVTKLIEYTEVNGKRDMTNGLGGLAFTMTSDDPGDNGITVKNPPIADMTISGGEMIVSVATNYAFISGKDFGELTDYSSYGYKFAESNYNPAYNTYYNNDEANDNDEFMWSANIVGTIDMSHLTGRSHSYSKVNVPASCTEDKYTVSRCSTCGLIQETTTAEANVQTVNAGEDEAILSVKITDGAEEGAEVVGTGELKHTRTEEEAGQESYEFTAEEIGNFVATIKLTEGYELAENTYADVTVKYGESGEVSYAAKAKEPEVEKKVATLSITVKAKDVTVGSETMTSEEAGPVGTDYTFEKAKIQATVEGLTLSEGYVLDNNTYEDVIVAYGSTGEANFAASKEQATATLTIEIKDSTNAEAEALKTDVLTADGGKGDTHTFAAEDIQTKAEEMAKELNGYTLDAHKYASEDVVYGETKTLTLTATPKDQAEASLIVKVYNTPTVPEDPEEDEQEDTTGLIVEVKDTTSGYKGDTKEYTAADVESLVKKEVEAKGYTLDEIPADTTYTVTYGEDDVVVKLTATAGEGHTYVKFNETYYTKSNDNWQTGTCYACIDCGHAFELEDDETVEDHLRSNDKVLTDKEVNSYKSKQTEVWTWSTDKTQASLYTVPTDLMDHMFDCVWENTSWSSREVATVEGDCETGKFTATLKSGKTSTATVTAGHHSYLNQEEKDDDGKVTQEAAVQWSWADDCSSATVTFLCDVCGKETSVTVKQGDENMAAGDEVAPTCTEAGYITYTATVTVDDVHYISSRDLETEPAAGHNYKDGVCTECGAEQGNPFVDVSEDDYYYDAVLWAYNNGITSGTDATHFSPGGSCSRAQVVTFLWRTMGEPEPETTKNPFVDVSEETYYYKAVLWAVEQGITTGTDKTHFAPGNSVTRSQFVTFLHRNEGEPKPESNENPFVDVSENEYYYDAVIWAYENGITTGTDETHFSPDKTCTRGQVVAFLYRTYGEEK